MDLLDDDSARKIVIIGPEKAGKTTYISRYVHGVYLPDEAYRKTIGVDFALKHLHWDDKKVTLQLWDIAGQERTEKMSRMYYQDAHACVIMFDMTYEKSLEICLRWKEDLNSKCTLENGEPLPCILLANKSDLVDKRKFTPEQIEKFAKDNGFLTSFETSVKANKNVTEAMEYLVHHLMANEDSVVPVPRARGIDVSVPVPPNNKPSCNC